MRKQIGYYSFDADMKNQENWLKGIVVNPELPDGAFIIQCGVDFSIYYMGGIYTGRLERTEDGRIKLHANKA